ncbi:hypothetical protein OG613_48960 (plasmid) [Streptomyces sp. NBC_00015]|uniref:hypothetical protein n=1 Tax=Streptomyces sp. NBC_00015 TaxID=2903611 RepID=UPI002F90C9EA
MTRPNTELAARIHAHITEHPEHLDQEVWLYGADVLHPTEDLTTPTHCGTTLCVAGYAVHFTGHVLLRGGVVEAPGTGKWHGVERVAREQLRLSEPDAAWLFDRRRTREEILAALGQLADGAAGIDTDAALTSHSV